MPTTPAISSTKYWLAQCASCGPVKIKQKTKPTSCKEEQRTGPRSIRRCGQPLTEQRDVTAQVLTALAAQAVA